jgi:hypothetical protein
MYRGTLVCAIDVGGRTCLIHDLLRPENRKETLSVPVAPANGLAVPEIKYQSRHGMADMREVPVHGLRVE